MSLVDQADRLLMDNKAPVITDAMQAALTRNVTESIDKLGATALRIRNQRDAAVGALRDIHFGAQMQIDSGLWSGAALGYIKEVKRVSAAALAECDA